MSSGGQAASKFQQSSFAGGQPSAQPQQGSQQQMANQAIGQGIAPMGVGQMGGFGNPMQSGTIASDPPSAFGFQPPIQPMPMPQAQSITPSQFSQTAMQAAPSGGFGNPMQAQLQAQANLGGPLQGAQVGNWGGAAPSQFSQTAMQAAPSGGFGNPMAQGQQTDFASMLQAFRNQGMFGMSPQQPQPPGNAYGMQNQQQNGLASLDHGLRRFNNYSPRQQSFSPYSSRRWQAQ